MKAKKEIIEKILELEEKSNYLYENDKIQEYWEVEQQIIILEWVLDEVKGE